MPRASWPAGVGSGLIYAASPLIFAEDFIMLRWALVFLIIALVAGALGFFHASFIASEIAWILFVVFLILFVVSLVLGRGRPPA
jgi:uncharacterized membrane protein YtjA (UPF0391 family)